jgi:hypothetical protein
MKDKFLLDGTFFFKEKIIGYIKNQSISYLAIIYSLRRPLREMDCGLLPTGNRHTRHLTTFSTFFFPDPMMYISLELYIYVYTLPFCLLLFY